MADLISFVRTEAVLKEYAEKAVELYKGKLTESGRVATRGLIDSVRTTLEVGNTTLAVDMHLAEYWKYVEWDTRPHWPPSGCLLKWIEAKELPVHKTRGDGLPTPVQLDFLIRRKISRSGTKGSHDLADTVSELNRQYEERIADAVAADFGSQVDVILRTFARA